MTLLAVDPKLPEHETFDGVTVGCPPPRAIASLAKRRTGEFDEAAASLFPDGLPGPARSTTAEPWSAFWTGPDQWFVTAPVATHEDIEARLRRTFRDAGSITEQTGAWTGFDLEGERAADVMERLVMLDFRTWDVGRVERTLVHHIGTFVGRTDTGYSFLGPRSSSRSLHHALVTAARSVC